MPSVSLATRSQTDSQMLPHNLIAALTALVVYTILSPAEAYAWGPATHIHLAHEMLGHLALLPATVAGILSRFAADFVFGNIAADVVFAKDSLADELTSREVPFENFTSLRDVMPTLERLLADLLSGARSAS